MSQADRHALNDTPPRHTFISMLASTADIRAELEQLTDLPAPVHGWLVEVGLDATDNPAVWVWALIESDDYEPDRMTRLKTMVHDAVRNTFGLWAYVLVRGVDETEATA